MRCKKGDLAIVVRSDAGNEGKIVRCVEFIGGHLWRYRSGELRLVPTWRIDREVRSFEGSVTCRFPDDQLRPIRPDAEPESTTTPRELEAA